MSFRATIGPWLWYCFLCVSKTHYKPQKLYRSTCEICCLDDEYLAVSEKFSSRQYWLPVRVIPPEIHLDSTESEFFTESGRCGKSTHHCSRIFWYIRALPPRLKTSVFLHILSYRTVCSDLSIDYKNVNCIEPITQRVQPSLVFTNARYWPLNDWDWIVFYVSFAV